jgi:hypothetical protein
MGIPTNEDTLPAMTPLQLCVLAHHHMFLDPLPSRHDEPPMAFLMSSAYADLRDMCLLQRLHKTGGGSRAQYKVTAKGEAHLKYLLNIRLPTEITVWVHQ